MYTFEPHYTVEATVHLALIPLGKLEAGEYKVNFVQEEMDRKYVDAGFVRVYPGQVERFVCQPFSFRVYDPPGPAPEDDRVSELIPLDRVWGLDMPGTRDVRELDPRNDVAQITAIMRIDESLMRHTDLRDQAGPCFLVLGEDKDALMNAAEVLTGGAAPRKVLPADKAVSLVFYSYAAPGYVHLQSVRHVGRRVTVRYQVVIHQSAEATTHFALIPLGKLTPGEIAIEAIEVASVTPYTGHDQSNRAICDSCVFAIDDDIGE